MKSNLVCWFLVLVYDNRICQWIGHRSFELEGIFEGHLVQLPFREQGHLQVDQVAQSLVQPDLKCVEEWDISHLSGQPISMLHFLSFPQLVLIVGVAVTEVISRTRNKQRIIRITWSSSCGFYLREIFPSILRVLSMEWMKMLLCIFCIQPRRAGCCPAY